MKSRSIRFLVLLLIILVAALPAACAATTSSTTAGTTKAAAATTAAPTTTVKTYYNKTGFPIVNDPITITVAGPNGNGGQDWNQTNMVKAVKEKFGITLNCTTYDTAAWQTQVTLMLASDKLPDLLLNAGLDLATTQKNGADGFFLTVDKYLDLAPAITAIFKDYPAFKARLTASDGHIYGFTQLNRNWIAGANRSYMNKEWLDKVGKKVPATIDELYEVLKAFKTMDPNGKADEIPMEDDDFGTVQNAFGILSQNKNYILQADASNKVFLADATDNYKAYLKFMNKCYKEGLLNNQTFIQTAAELNTKVADNLVGTIQTGSAPYVMAGKDGKFDEKWTYWGGMTSANNATATAVIKDMVSSSIKVAISADTKYPEAIIRLIDYYFTDDGSIAASYGYEGSDWDYTSLAADPTSKIVTMRKPDGFASAEEYRYKKALINEGFNIMRVYIGSFYQYLHEKAKDTVLTDVANFTPLNFGWAVMVETGVYRNAKIKKVDSFPGLVYNAKVTERRASLATDITLYLKTMRASFISGEIDIDAKWSEYLATLKQMGLEELLKIEQDAYSATLTAK